ncbi:MAG TPA: hypothetical protein VKB65_00150 [Myxococcota bacterium]|nr:hypothetical protein [Myxococcota bacterium]
MDASSLDYAFGAVLLVFVTAGLALRRATTRAALGLAGAAPLVAFVAYEALVGRVMPHADIRLDWLLLVPIALAHGLHSAARWRRLGSPTVD